MFISQLTVIGIHILSVAYAGSFQGGGGGGVKFENRAEKAFYTFLKINLTKSERGIFLRYPHIKKNSGGGGGVNPNPHLSAHAPAFYLLSQINFLFFICLTGKLLSPEETQKCIRECTLVLQEERCVHDMEQRHYAR